MDLLDISHCTFSEYDSDGFLGIQADAYASKGRGVGAGHHLSPGGLDHRPVDPQGEVGELCLVIPDGHQNFVLPLNDVRTEAKLPNLNKGATRIFDTGSFKGFPFHFTALLDPIAEQMVFESHRGGGVIQIKNAEGVELEISDRVLSVEGATSVELGGDKPLALAPAVEAALTSLQGFIDSAAATEAGQSGAGGMTALSLALKAWKTSVSATIAKGA